MSTGTKENPIASSLDPMVDQRGGKYCLCGSCLNIKRCTPDTDFYKREGLHYLLCESCICVKDAARLEAVEFAFDVLNRAQQTGNQQAIKSSLQAIQSLKELFAA